MESRIECSEGVEARGGCLAAGGAAAKVSAAGGGEEASASTSAALQVVFELRERDRAR